MIIMNGEDGNFNNYNYCNYRLIINVIVSLTTS